MEASQPIVESTVQSVQYITTGYGEQHREHRYRSRKPLMWWVLTSRSWIEIPIGVYVIHHRDGVVLFDTGMDPAITARPDYITSPIGRFLMRRIFRFHITPEDALGRQLEAIEVAPATVRKVVISHLHFDHIGGIADVPNAEIFVNRKEWQRLNEPHPERDWILREHIEIPGVNWQRIEFGPTDDPLLANFGGCYDLMNDGSLVLLPTPGHTRGSMSLLLRSPNLPPMLLIGDLAFSADQLLNDQLPGLGEEPQLRASYARVRALKQQLPELLILPSHDPAALELFTERQHAA